MKKIAIPYMQHDDPLASSFQFHPASHGPRPGRIYPYNVVYLQEQHDHVIEISGASGTVELCATAVFLVVLAGSVALRLDDGVEPLHHTALGMMVARALALGGLVGVDVDRPIVHLDLHHGVHRIPAVALVAGRRRRTCRSARSDSWGDSGLSLAARTDLTVGRALVALTAEADQVALAGEVAVLAVHDDVAVTSAELADRALVAVCEQIDWLATTGCLLPRLRPSALWEATSDSGCRLGETRKTSARDASANSSEIIGARKVRL